MKTIIQFAVLFLIINIQAIAQPGSRSGNAANMPADGVLTGFVYDKESGKPIEYANIALYTMRDSVLVNGAITTPDGKFNLAELPYGKYRMTVNFIGFETFTVTDIMINPRQKVFDAGKIVLSAADMEVAEVEIIADRKHVEYKIDKKVINVSQDIVAAAGTVVDVLQNIPSVQVDIDGNVALRGTSNFTVLIDGKPSVLKGNDALQTIPASSIENIEIITNPSAKYDPDGVGGIINIIMKKNNRPGLNGIVNLSVGTRDKYKGDILINMVGSKYTISMGMDYSDNTMYGSGEGYQENYFNDTTFRVDNEGDRNFRRKGGSFKLGGDYKFNENNFITVSSSIGKRGFDRNFTSNYHEFYIPVFTDTYYRDVNFFDVNNDFYSINSVYTRTFGKPDHKIEFQANFSNTDGNDFQDQATYVTDANWTALDPNAVKLRSTDNEAETELRFKIDYTMPLSATGKFEAGLQSINEKSVGERFTENFDYTTQNWVKNDLLTTEADFDHNVYAAYSTYSNTFGSFGVQLGLRGEFTDQILSTPDTTFEVVRPDFFPTIHISKQFAGDYQLQASYTKRIRRPGERELNPIPMYSDQYSRMVGNPALTPEYTHSYELNLQKRFGANMLSFETYMRQTTDLITRVQTIEDGLFIRSFENLNTDYSIGAELMGNFEIRKFMSLSISGNVYQYYLEGKISDESVSNESFNWNARTGITFKLPTSTRFQINGFYNSPSATAQGESTGFFMVDAAVRQELLNRNLTLGLQIRDPFGTAKHGMTSYGKNYETYNLHAREFAVVTFTASYRINNYKRTGRERNMEDNNGGGFDEMM